MKPRAAQAANHADIFEIIAPSSRHFGLRLRAHGDQRDALRQDANRANGAGSISDNGRVVRIPLRARWLSAVRSRARSAVAADAAGGVLEPPHALVGARAMPQGAARAIGFEESSAVVGLVCFLLGGRGQSFVAGKRCASS